VDIKTNIREGRFRNPVVERQIVSAGEASCGSSVSILRRSREGYMKVEKSELNDLFAMLLRLKAAFSEFFAMEEWESGCDEALVRIKACAHRLHAAIDQACQAGNTVILHTERGGGRTHFVRTVGPLNADGVTFKYSPESHSGRPLNQCVLVAMTWIDTVVDIQLARNTIH
jgi:hypothetical protein